MERYKFYKDLSIQQIQFADSLTPPEFANWVNNGGRSPLLLDRPSFDLWMQSGGTKAALNQLIENAHVRSRTGQTPATHAGFSLVTDVVTIPPYESNSVMEEMWASAIRKFRARYPQYVDNAANTALWKRFIIANRDNTGMGLKPCFENVEAFFKTCFSRLTLRTVTKVVKVAGEQATTGEHKLVKESIKPGQSYNPFLFTDIQQRNKKIAAKKAQDAARAQSPYARPELESTLVERILSPSDVQNLSADEHALLMSPMIFPSVTDSAEAYTKSERFIEETPGRQTRAQREQTPEQIQREIVVFCNAFPDYGRYASDAANYDGLNQRVLEAIDGWGLLITASSLKDGYDFAASQGWIPRAVDHADAQVSRFHVTPDLNPPATNAGSIRYHGKLVRDMSSAELQQAMNDSPELRQLLDRTA
jgi:hypothetical protein